MSMITVDQALARLNTWKAEPDEDTTRAIVYAALHFVDGGTREALDNEVKKYRSEQREMAYEASSFGCEIDAETARQDLRDATEIIDLDGDHGMDPIGVAMMKARGCHIAAKVPRLQGKWVGFGSRKAVP